MAWKSKSPRMVLSNVKIASSNLLNSWTCKKWIVPKSIKMKIFKDNLLAFQIEGIQVAQKQKRRWKTSLRIPKHLRHTTAKNRRNCESNHRWNLHKKFGVWYDKISCSAKFLAPGFSGRWRSSSKEEIIVL